MKKNTIRMQETIIVIGAGVAGLMAARELAVAGRQVVVLEGTDRIGGRINTIQPPGFSCPVETGAEFVHGKLPVTRQLLKEAGIYTQAVSGRMLRVQGDQWTIQDEMVPGWDELETRMRQLQNDITIGDFLQQYFPGEEHAHLRTIVQGFAQGFDLADISKASVFALREEWMQEEPEQYRVAGGYKQLVDHLAQQSTDHGAVIHTSSTVKKISWKKDEVQVLTADGRLFNAHKVVITVPLGVLQTGDAHSTAIVFEPGIDQYKQAFHGIGFGTVTKILLQFTTPFWKARHEDTGFVLSEEMVPTWWTQLPDKYPLLTGWLGGPPANAHGMDDTMMLERALQSLAGIYKMEVYELQKLLSAWHITQWHNNAYTLGAYSYSTLYTTAARKLLATPVEQTLFFAGEALYEGPASATVEAALVSGRDTAQNLLRILLTD
jgi:monoamine oxidase